MSLAAADRILEAVGPQRRDPTRRQLLLGPQTILNGIDFVEYEEVPAAAGAPARHLLHVTLLKPAALTVAPSQVSVLGGTRIPDIRVLDVSQGTPTGPLMVEVDKQGDFSRYLLAIGWTRVAVVGQVSAADSDAWRFAMPGLDRLFSVARVDFRPGCPVDADCASECECDPDPTEEPVLDYMARDYASFRRMLLDFVGRRNADWSETNPSDLGMVLLELLADEGDRLAYYQDAVAMERFLETARHRASARRHARLIDYRMHDGRNAWTWVHFDVTTAGTVPAHLRLLTRITSPLRRDRTIPAVTMAALRDEDYRGDPALAQVRVFETTAMARLHPRNNELRIHTWGNEDWHLPAGSTVAHVYAIENMVAVRPPLVPGDRLLLEEVVGPDTGSAADADPTHRAVVEIVSVVPDGAGTSTAVGQTSDPMFLATIDPGTNEPTPVDWSMGGTPGPALPLVEVTWRRADAPAFPVCVAVRTEDGSGIRNVSVARGNMVPADHGRSIIEKHAANSRVTAKPGFRLRLDQSPLTMQWEGLPRPVMSVQDRWELDGDAADATPAVTFNATRHGSSFGTWHPVRDLLSSKASDRHFVAEVDQAGRAHLRAGQGGYGQLLSDVDEFEVRYRVGNGRQGNIGVDALHHVETPPANPRIVAVRNPLPARGGVDPETIDEVRHRAPAAFHATQLRAVTEDDYVEAARSIEGVSGAVAAFRWTGSWFTLFAAIDPANPDDVVTDLRGHARLAPEFRERVRAGLERRRLAGYDLEIRAARYVALEIAIEICAAPGHFRGDVARAVALALAGGRRGGPPPYFDPSNFTFGDGVHLSGVYAAVEAVEGVASAEVTKFQRRDRPTPEWLARGTIAIGPWEIARLEADPSRRENGTLTVVAIGGGS